MAKQQTLLQKLRPDLLKGIRWFFYLLIAGIIGWSMVPKAVKVDVLEIRQGTVFVSVHGEGKSRVRQSYIISAPVSGRLQRINIKPGGEVIGGQTVVARIEPANPSFLDIRTQAQAEARIGAAEAARDLAAARLESAEAEHEFTTRELERAEELSAAGNISAQILDKRKRDLRIAHAQVEEARSNLAVADADLVSARATLLGPNEGEAGRQGAGGCCVEVISPVSGRLLRLLQESEQVVQAGMPLVALGDLSEIELVADLLSTDAVKVRPGDHAFIDHWGGDHVLSAKVRVVEPSGFTKISALGIEEQRVNVILDITDERSHWQALGDGYRIEADIVVEEKHDVILVPVSALFRQDGQWMVYLSENDEAILATVELGLRNEHAAEVISGLRLGQKVVIHPPNSLEDRAAIEERE